MFSNIHLFQSKIGIQGKNKIYVLLLTIFVVLMLIEDYLIRAYGVTLYSLVIHVYYI